MNFIHSDLGFRQQGDLIEITLSSGANVRLMDNAEFSSYQRGRAHRFIGGLAQQSPVRLAIPSAGHWHVAVDMQGLRGSARASIRVLSNASG